MRLFQHRCHIVSRAATAVLFFLRLFSVAFCQLLTNMNERIRIMDTPCPRGWSKQIWFIENCGLKWDGFVVIIIVIIFTTETIYRRVKHG